MGAMGDVIDFRMARVRAEADVADDLIGMFGKSTGRQLRELARFLDDLSDREMVEILAEAVEAKLGFRLLPIYGEG